MDIERHIKRKLGIGPRSPNKQKRTSSHAEGEVARYQSRILDNMSDGVYALNTGGYFTYVNKIITERYGITAERFYQLHFLDIIDPEYHDLAKENFRRVMKGEDGVPYELSYTDVDGEVQNIEVHSRPVREGGRVIGLLGMARNITARKRQEEVLKKSEEKYRAILENAGDAILLADERGSVLEANNRAEKLFGYKRKELLGMNYYKELCPALGIRRTVKVLKNIFNEGHGFPHNSVILRKDGTIVDVEITGSIITYDNCRVIQISFRDITDQVRAKEILERTVKERTAELFEKNRQLISEIKERKQAETGLKRKTKELHLYSEKLEELNAALKVLLKQREEDKAELEEKVLSNVKHLLSPHLERLKTKNLDSESSTILEILDSNLKNIISPFSLKLSSKFVNLTPTEIKVANLIREGMPTKEIARLMNISSNAVNHHRHHIRDKFGILSQKVNLRSYISTLS